MIQLNFSIISRDKDPYAMCFAFFQLITRNKTPEQLAESSGTRVKNFGYMKSKKFGSPNGRL